MFGLKQVLHNCRIREKTHIFDTFCGKCGGMFLFSVGGCCIWFSCGCWIILARSCLQLVCKFTSLKLPPSPRQFALIPTGRTFGKDVWVKTSAAQLQNSWAREDYKMVEENTYDTVCGKCGGIFLFSVGGCIWFSCSWLDNFGTFLSSVGMQIHQSEATSVAKTVCTHTYLADLWERCYSRVRKDCKMVWRVLVFSWWLYAVLLQLLDDFGTFLSSIGMQIHQSEATSVAKTVCTDTYLADLWERCLG